MVVMPVFTKGYFVHILGIPKGIHSSAPKNRTMAGAAAMAKPHRPQVSIMALSPKSGLASLGEKPEKYSPFTGGAASVNHWSPRTTYPDTHIDTISGYGSNQVE